MDKVGSWRRLFFDSLCSFQRNCIFYVLSVGPISNHIAFIMDGNCRYAKKWNMVESAGHRVGFLALISMLRYCYELGVKYVTVYVFNVDNLKRKPEEVQALMDLMEEKIEGLMKEESIVNRYGVRVHFIRNLKLLNKSVREATVKVMVATANNSKVVLSICVAYTSTDEIVNTVQRPCDEKLNKTQEQNSNEARIEEYDHDQINLVNIEKHMYMAIAPNPDILIRTSGRLD